MLLLNLVSAVLAVTLPAPSPTPLPEPKTIITVTSSPYCNSLGSHFNGALLPLLANDRTLDGVSVQLDDFDGLFSQVNYTQQFLHVRDTLGRQETALNNSLAGIQREINALREGSRLTTVPPAAAGVDEAAQDLQTAYDRQRQLAIDLQNLYEWMLQYNLNRLHPALGGFDPQDMAAPEDARSIKSYLRFNGQRDIVATNEDKAADAALNAAQTYCTPKQ
jgi:hypothetical protein